MNDDLMEALLNDSEGSALDFKREQYPFQGATDEQKGELLKDVLAFANSWRQADAYILIGVQDVRGGRAAVHGVTVHIDDAHLQQFINGKTNRPVDLHYRAYPFEGVTVGVIHIPKQERPTYSRKEYGKVKAGIIYYRQGSSTAIASPEVIARMGRADVEQLDHQLDISIGFAETRNRQRIGATADVKCVIYADPTNPHPDAGHSADDSRDFLAIRPIFPIINKDYWRELDLHHRAVSACQAVGLVASNRSRVLARNVRAVIEFDDAERVAVLDTKALPEEPVWELMSSIQPATAGMEEAIYRSASRQGTRVEHHGTRSTVTVGFGDIQPKADAWARDPFYIGSGESRDLTADAVVYADNLPDPIRTLLTFRFAAERRGPLTQDDLEEIDATLSKR